ncbi:MAG: AAA family ATPase [Kiritimatiellae bacterium]|nr:AAA family ATPase [Kiritimatiellia bacterium]
MKAKLTVTCNNQTKAYALPEQGVKIGRDPGQCQLALQDPDVSSLHAFMCCKNGAWMLQDLGSTNGTYVNGNKITTVGLKSGDRIKFGVSVSAKIEIEEPKKEIVAPPKPATPPPPPQKTAIKVDNTPPPEMSADDVELIKLLNDKFNLAKENLSQVVIGQMDVIELVLTAIFARGHVLLMGVPGLAKTLLIATLSQVLDLKFKRVQFTPDLMPSDITGTDVLEEDKESGGRKFRFVEGPVFTNMLLADEINRTPPKTQAALLEAMQEHHITVGTKTYNLPEPFFVMATQNPIEQEGTYPLPEAQMDRFLFNIIVKYPSAADEETIIRNVTSNRKVKLEKVLDGETVQKLQDVVKRVPVAPHVIQYAATLARMSRPKEPDVPDFVKELVGWGAGPRAGISLITAAKAWAILHGRHHCTMKDVEAVAMPVLRHRVITTFAAEAAGVTSDDLVNMLLKELKPTLDLEI